jgi:hypothetical protein
MSSKRTSGRLANKNINKLRENRIDTLPTQRDNQQKLVNDTHSERGRRSKKDDTRAFFQNRGDEPDGDSRLCLCRDLHTNGQTTSIKTNIGHSFIILPRIGPNIS